MDWYHRHSGTNSDPKLKRVAKATGLHFCFVLAVWDEILEYVNAQEERGSLDGFDFELVACNLDLDVDTVIKIIDEMEKGKRPLHRNGIVTSFVTRNKKRNKDSNETVTAKSNAQRQREFRERLKNQIEDDTVTNRNGENALRIDKNREEEIIKNSEEDKSSSSFCLELEKPEAKKIIFDFDTIAFSNITDQQKTKWAEAYPAIDIEKQIAAAAAWLQANPKMRKSNYAKFLVNWFSRAQDKASRIGSGSSPPLSYEQRVKDQNDQAIEEARKRYAQPN